MRGEGEGEGEEGRLLTYGDQSRRIFSSSSQSKHARTHAAVFLSALLSSDPAITGRSPLGFLGSPPLNCRLEKFTHDMTHF